MIEFACHTWAFNDLTLPEALGTIARLGFRYVDIGSGQNLNAAKTAQDPKREAAQVRADLEMYNLKVSDVYLVLPRISLPDEEARARDLDIFRALLPFVKEVGSPGVTVSPGLMQADEAAWGRAVDGLRAMLDATDKELLRLSIEPHLDSMAATPELALKLVDDIPGLSLTLDWAHMVCQHIAHEQIVSLLPHTRHLQIRQAARGRLQTPLDRGKIDLAAVMSALVEANYNDIVCIEYMNIPGWHGMMPVDAIAESARLRDALRSLRDAGVKSAS
jgi:sugar phosphate isomerase/epimerase